MFNRNHIVLCVVVLGLSTFLLRILLANTINCQAFYIERGSYKVGSDGERKLFNREIIARRSDGATATVEFALGRPGFRKVILPDTTKTWLVDDLRAKTSWRKMNEEAQALMNQVAHPIADCGLGERISGDAVVAGQRTLLVVDDSNPNVQEKRWFAPDLGCNIVQYQKLTKQGNLLTEIQSFKLLVAEPDPQLFDLGASYAEVLPSELIKRHSAAVGLHQTSPEYLRYLLEVDREFRATPRQAK